MLKDLIYAVASYLRMDDVCDYLDSLNQEETGIIVTDSETFLTEPKEIKLLTNLTNLVLGQILREYMPLYTEEIVSSNANCEISFSSFSKKVNQIINVSFVDGLNSTFRIFPEYIKVGSPQEKYVVKYSYLPEEITNFNAPIEKPISLSENTIALGVCAEYCLIEMLYDEADMWEAKFKESLQNTIRKLREKRLPSRGWI